MHDYARWGRWVWRTLIVVPVLVVLWNIGQAIWGGPKGGVTLGIHGEIDRPVLGFSVNGMAGANAFTNSGGSITYCGDISGDMAEVIWTLSTTRTQYNAGMRLEKRNMTLPLPKRERGEDFLHVYSMPGDKMLLGWNKDSLSPHKDLYNEEYKTRVR